MKAAFIAGPFVIQQNVNIDHISLEQFQRGADLTVQSF